MWTRRILLAIGLFAFFTVCFSNVGEAERKMSKIVSTTALRVVYVTAPSAEVAKTIARYFTIFFTILVPFY